MSLLLREMDKTPAVWKQTAVFFGKIECMPPEPQPKPRMLSVAGSAVVLILAVVTLFGYWQFFSAPQSHGEPETFLVAIGASTEETLMRIKGEGFIRNLQAFNLLQSGEIEPGAYKFEKDMSAFRVASVLRAGPFMKWVVIPEGLRKEEIADLLAETLLWSERQKDQWIKIDTAVDAGYIEGVYFPDTYLIPSDEDPAATAARLRAKFEEKFAPYAAEAIKQNIKWTTLVKLASIVQREAAGKSDMPLVAGILWNRLLADMRLEVDATLQYIKGSADRGWWPAVVPADKQLDSPYNTYRYAGLPPQPISNPGVEAIAATLAPAKTDCLYYLHDNAGAIHCSKTYAGHLENIRNYLQ
jgi:UPF0755 protein